MPVDRTIRDHLRIKGRYHHAFGFDRDEVSRNARDLLMEARALAFNFRVPLFFRKGSLRSFVERAGIAEALDRRSRRAPARALARPASLPQDGFGTRDGGLGSAPDTLDDVR